MKLLKLAGIASATVGLIALATLLAPSVYGQAPDRSTLPLMMLAVDGMTIPEIAEILEIPQGTVKSRVFYARKRLKSALENRLERNRK